MFDFLQPRKDVAPKDSRSVEAIANKELVKADDGAEAEKNQKAQTPRNDHAASLPAGEAKHPGTPHAESKIHREAVTALNVKVVCDLAGLLPDKAKYEVTQGRGNRSGPFYREWIVPVFRRRSRCGALQETRRPSRCKAVAGSSDRQRTARTHPKNLPRTATPRFGYTPPCVA